MILLTRQFLADRAARRFADQHRANLDDTAAWRKTAITKRTIHEQLVSMDPPTPEKVAKIIGNDSWTRLACDSCSKEVERAVSIDVTGGEYTTHVCEKCAKKMTELFT